MTAAIGGDIMFKRFAKDNEGSMLVEFVILLAFIGVVAVIAKPYLHPFLEIVAETISAPINHRNDDQATGEVNAKRALSKPILSISQSDQITSSTPLTFSASANPYSFSWSGYNGNSDGSEGLKQTFTVERHTVTASLSGSNMECYFISTITSEGCTAALSFDTFGTKTIEAKVCQNGNCEVRSATVEVSYPKIEASISTDRSFPSNDTDFVKFKANVSGGSGEYKITWTGVDGPTVPNEYGKDTKLSSGTHTVRLSVCDANQTDLCSTSDITFEIKKTYQAVPLEGRILSSFGNKMMEGENVSFNAVHRLIPSNGAVMMDFL
jgi:hypothetical protein